MAGIPAKIGNFEVIRQIGSGGMGAVYLGRDPELDRQVAIKVIREEVHDQEVLDRFFREARAAAALRHANIITVYASGQQDHQPYIAMEYIEGESLSDIIKERRTMPLSEKVTYIEQICSGLAFAHKAGIVHRDVKPANIMLDRERVVRILDFGIARIEGSAMTQDGTMMGSLNYMSPEQMLGRPVDLRSDVFSVGSVAYELLSYEQAFKGNLNDGILHRLPHEDPPSLLDLCPGLPLAIEQTIMRALEKDPGRRFQTLSEMQTALVNAQAAAKKTAAARPSADERTMVIERPPTATGAPAASPTPVVALSAGHVSSPAGRPVQAAPLGEFKETPRGVPTPTPSTPPPLLTPRPALKLKSETTAPPRPRPVAEKPPTTGTGVPLSHTGKPVAPPPAPSLPLKKWALIGVGVLVAAISLASIARSWLNASPDPVDEERPAIEATMGEYRNAYRNRDLEGVTKVFPTLAPEARQAMQQEFRECLVYEVTFAELQVTVNTADPTRAQVDLRSTHTCTPNSGGRQTETSRHDLFELSKNGDAWLIDRARPAPASAGGSQ